jgi:hypothetical protein
MTKPPSMAGLLRTKGQGAAPEAAPDATEVSAPELTLPRRAPKPPADPRLPITIKLPQSMLTALKAASYHEERTRQDIIEEGVRQVLVRLGYMT